jgi:leucyl-tRNA synthetase
MEKNWVIMKEKYFAQEIEAKWQQRWADARAFEVEPDPSNPKFYCLEMLPYPSGRIHMGHVRNYAIGDALSWYKRLRGYNVLHPIGWDSFGQPAEQAAIKRGIHPATWTEDNIAHMRQQLKRLGISYDWRRETAAHTPEYYRWNQWFFLKMYERDLIYRKSSPVNWCPHCQTVLSNEQAQGGCWRCGSEVEQRELEQWFARITNYAEDLLNGLDQLEAGWPEKVLTMQRNWIGRSEGALVDFAVEGMDEKIKIFTTRVDTIFGANCIILAPEHPLAQRLAAMSSRRDEVLAFSRRMAQQDRRVRSADDAEKEGVDTGVRAINPYNGERLPIWIANFILMEYGTGAIMSVPAHDQRDYDFARKYDLPIRQVIAPLDDNGRPTEFDDLKEAYDGDGVLINSGAFNGLPSQQAIRRMAQYAEEKGFGKGTVQYKLRDWGMSRQRYWGTPVPMVHCPNCGIVPVPENQLPVMLPPTAPFTGESGSPLDHVPEFVHTTCPKCQGPARRDTDTMDTFVDSNWYYYRYCDPKNDRAPFDPAIIRQFMPVEQYIGGVEHAVMHLLYTRFWTKFMRDMGLIEFSEPVTNLLTQGMVTNIVTEGPDKGQWKKMSKSLGNGVDPDEMIDIHGADTVRVFMLFAAPPEAELRWLEDGVEGAARFLRRVYTLVARWHQAIRERKPGKIEDAGEFNQTQRQLLRKTHQTILGVTRDIEDRLQFNTAIAKLMELVNAMYDFDATVGGAVSATDADLAVFNEALNVLVRLLAPFAPHVAEEMWEGLGHSESLTQTRWPTYDEALAREDVLEIPVQINGKLRSRIFLTPDAAPDQYEQLALADEKVQSLIDGKSVAKVIVVPQRMVNVVVK